MEPRAERATRGLAGGHTMVGAGNRRFFGVP
jgi:hypothetical protein